MKIYSITLRFKSQDGRVTEHYFVSKDDERYYETRFPSEFSDAQMVNFFEDNKNTLAANKRWLKEMANEFYHEYGPSEPECLGKDLPLAGGTSTKPEDE